MINILLSGCSGNMGKVLAKIISDDENTAVVCGYDININCQCGFPVYDDFSKITEKVDVVIDFSHPDTLKALIPYCVENNIPVVVATTGLSGEQIDKVKKASEKIPVFFTANMSLGVNLIVNLAKKAAKILEGNFDIEIIEKHHNKKIDAPSGTALMIADAVSDVLKNQPEYIYDRHCVRKKREKNEIGIHSVRGGTIVGEHEIIFAGCDEQISIKHTATSKEVFAVGGVRAAKFLAGKSAGLYDMSDLMKF